MDHGFHGHVVLLGKKPQLAGFTRFLRWLPKYSQWLAGRKEIVGLPLLIGAG
jgi:hypothetical protein